MNHDATHCLDYDPKTCPSECYRAQLTAELKLRDDLKYMPMSWSHFINTDECYMRCPSYISMDGAKFEMTKTSDWFGGETSEREFETLEELLNYIKTETSLQRVVITYNGRENIFILEDYNTWRE